jgi:hypothetical protein
MNANTRRAALTEGYPSVLKHIHNTPRRSFGLSEFVIFCLLATACSSTLFNGVAVLLTF